MIFVELAMSEELTSCITLNVLFLENSMFQLSNAVFAECFDHLERFLRHFENQKILTFWAIFEEFSLPSKWAVSRPIFSTYPNFDYSVTNMSVLLDPNTLFFHRQGE